jgi:hypothetical protein
MNRAFTKRAVIVLFSLLLTAGCGGKASVSPETVVAEAFEDLRTQVADVIEDDDRRDLAVAAVSEIESDYYALREAIQQRRTRLRALNADYDATREELIVLVDALEQDIRDARGAVAATRRELMSATTSGEWERLRKANTQTMKAAINALLST